MLTLIPMLEGECRPPTTAFGVSWHSDGELSRRQPAAAEHAVEMLVSGNRSKRTDVTSTPHLLLRLRVSDTPVWQPAGATGDRSVQGGASRMVCPTALFVTLKWPAQFTPFMSQNCGLATFVVPGADHSCSSGQSCSSRSTGPGSRGPAG